MSELSNWKQLQLLKCATNLVVGYSQGLLPSPGYDFFLREDHEADFWCWYGFDQPEKRIKLSIFRCNPSLLSVFKRNKGVIIQRKE